MEAQKTASGLTESELAKYREQGYLFPVEVFSPSEVVEFRAHFDEYFAYHRSRLEGLPPSKHASIYGHTHTFLRWVYRMISHRNVLDAVESILGPNLVVRDTAWFVKMPGDKKYISWHQDATYWGLHPPTVTTAWIALSDSITANGCLRVLPGSHKNPILPHEETYAPENALSRGQEIAVQVDEEQVVDVVLKPGQMSLHDVAIVHGSKANTSDQPRIGIAVRYMPTHVYQDGNVRQLAVLVRGVDEYGYADLIEPPSQDDPTNNALQLESLDRLFRNAEGIEAAGKSSA